MKVRAINASSYRFNITLNILILEITLFFVRIHFTRIMRLKIAEIEELFKNNYNARFKLHEVNFCVFHKAQNVIVAICLTIYIGLNWLKKTGEVE